MPTTKSEKPDTVKAAHKAVDEKVAKAPRKPRAASVKKEPVKHHAPIAHVAAAEPVLVAEEKLAVTGHPLKGRYIFATGRRKTAVANVRLFEGKGECVVNKKKFELFFPYSFYQEEIFQPFNLTGLAGQYFFTAHINGGGPHSQAGALRHGIASALGTISPEIRKVLKKNGLLTRDDRKKERKKPGLKRARRSPQWAKR